MVIQYWMQDMSCLTNVVTEPEWEGKAVKNQEDWIDITRSTTHLCHEETYLDDTKA